MESDGRDLPLPVISAPYYVTPGTAPPGRVIYVTPPFRIPDDKRATSWPTLTLHSCIEFVTYWKMS